VLSIKSEEVKKMRQIAICEDIESSSPLLSYTKAEAQKKSCASMLSERPSFNFGSRSKFSRLKLVVKSLCNVGNHYCEAKINPATRVTTAKEGIGLNQICCGK